MILVQISDTHIDAPGALAFGQFDTTATLARAVEIINAMDPGPDLVLHTGDIAAHGGAACYAAFKEIANELNAPLVLMPGNHDDRGALRDAFGGTPWLPATGDYLHYTIDDYPVRVICCDSVIAGDVPGEFCAERLDWLDARLSEAPEKPTIVALHHPPFDTGMTGSTAQGLVRGGAAFDALLRRHDNVVRVLAGHAHRPMTSTFGDAVAFAAPSTCYPFALETGPERILAATHEAPGVAVHLWLPGAGPSGAPGAAGAGLVTHTVPVGDWGDAIRIREDGVRVYGA